LQDRFAKLAMENEHALTSEDKDATLRRVPPASLVSTTGNEWKTLTAEVKAQYEERYVVGWCSMFVKFNHIFTTVVRIAVSVQKPIASATKNK
jgi:hypothetical protein